MATLSDGARGRKGREEYSSNFLEAIHDYLIERAVCALADELGKHEEEIPLEEGAINQIINYAWTDVMSAIECCRKMGLHVACKDVADSIEYLKPSIDKAIDCVVEEYVTAAKAAAVPASQMRYPLGDLINPIPLDGLSEQALSTRGNGKRAVLLI